MKNCTCQKIRIPKPKNFICKKIESVKIGKIARKNKFEVKKLHVQKKNLKCKNWENGTYLKMRIPKPKNCLC